MNRADAAFAELVAANPVPEHAGAPAKAWTEAALLAEIEMRSGRMQTQEITKTVVEPPSPKRSRALLVAVAAFAVVLIVVGVVAITTTVNDGQNAVTDTPTTVQLEEQSAPSTVATPAEGQTAETPTSDSAPTSSVARTPLEVATGYVDARNRYSADDMASFFADNAIISGDLTLSVAGYAGAVELERVTGWQYTLGTCRESLVGVVQQLRLQCAFTWENDWSRALELGPIGTTRTAFTFTIADGHIQRLEMTLDIGEFYTPVPGTNFADVNEQFVAWLDATHPDDMWALYNAGQCFPAGPCLPLLTPEAIDLWERYTKEFVEFVGSQSGG